MSTERFFLADPYNETHVNLFDKFEQDHQIITKTSTYLCETTTKYSKEEYEQESKQQNEIAQSLFLLQSEDTGETNKITDSCHIMGEKDRKICYIYFAPIKVASKNRKLVSLATDYAFNGLGMEEIFVCANTDDKALISNLEQENFASLGAENDSITYLKEREQVKEKGRVM